MPSSSARSSLARAARALGASLGAALVVLPATAVAQPAPAPPLAQPAPPPADRPFLPVRLDVDFYGGLTYRLGGDDVAQRGGGLLGASVLVGPPAGAETAGLGYERSFFGRERVDTGDGQFADVSRGLDALWLIGRVYPYQTDDLRVYATIGAAAAWQRVSSSKITLLNDDSGVIRPKTVRCSAGGPVGLGLRFGVGTELSITDYLGFTTSLGLDHVSVSDGSLDGCAAGLGPETTLAARFGFIFTGGRRKAPPARPAPPGDRDGDHIPDAADACPDVPGAPSANPAKHGCPLPGDRDADGITDDVDACPAEAGVPNQDPRKHGCPPPADRDGDKVSDAEDACPDLAGVATADPATNGCPPDTDGDGIRDDKDACREVKGVQSEDPAKNGCPLVVFTAKEIVIAQQVQFETDKAVIRPVSNALLDEVASVIKQHPEIEKIEVQGHTDSTGDKAHNKQLSKARAVSVRKALVARGIAAGSLDAKGYGQEQPIADNATDQGKALNRRVEFKISQKK